MVGCLWLIVWFVGVGFDDLVASCGFWLAAGLV